MAVTLFDSNFKEIGPAMVSCDIECGDSSSLNNLEVTSKLPSEAYGLCILGTEAGGFFEYLDLVTGQTPERKAWTLRGLLTQWVLCPPSGADYFTISNMELNAAVERILSGVLGNFFHVPNKSTGVRCTTFQANLYCTPLEAIESLLKPYGYKLLLRWEKNHTSKLIEAVAEAVPMTVIETAFDEDSGIKMEFIINGMKYNHIIAMGKGELQARERIDLYLQADGTWGSTQHFTGLSERQYYYNNSGSDKLMEDAMKKAQELAPSKQLKVMAYDIDLDIGDSIHGSYESQNINVESAISKKIYRISGDIVSIEYGVKEESK